MRVRPRRHHTRDAGASAVEFALVLPFLFMILFGVIQYGYGLFQLQNFNSIVDQASQMAGTGIGSCSTFRTQLKTVAQSNGIDPASITNIGVSWLKVNPANPAAFLSSSSAERSGLAKVSMTFKPFRLGVPFVPFPKQITRSQNSTIQDLGTLVGGC